MTTAAEARATRLAQEPMRPAGLPAGVARAMTASVRDIWAHRELLDLLVRRELRARYKDSALGFFWSLMRPLTLLLIYYLAIGKFLGAERAIPEFAIYIFTGLTAWQLFNEVVLSGTSSIVANGGLIKKVYVPREVYPLSTTGSALFNFAIQLGVLVVAAIIAGSMEIGFRTVYLPLSLAVILVFALSLALVLSAVNVYLRDVQYLVEITTMVLFWLSPVVYSWGQVSTAIGDSWVRELYLANPVTLAVLGFQRAFWTAGDGQPMPDHLGLRLCVSLAVGGLVLWLCHRVFTRLQGNFAQEL